MSSSAAIEVIHAGIPGRLRYRIRALHRNPSLAARVERELSRLAGIERVRANPVTATLLVLYTPDLPTPWETTLADVLGAPARAVETERAAPARSIAPSFASPLARLRSAVAEQRARRAEAVGPAPTRPDPGEMPDAGPAWHVLSEGEIEAQLGANLEEGLREERVSARLQADGPNALTPPPRRSELRIFADQLASTPVVMLGVSAVLSAATGGLADALAILVVLGVNAGIGYATESGAERTIEALTRTPQPQVPVLRAGVILDVPVERIVRGDLLVLRAGVFVAADARVVQARDLTLDESSLTGESMPVSKIVPSLERASVPLADRVNMVFRGTLVTGGSGLAVVVATGARTQVGHIQALASGVENRATPMQQQLDHLGRQLAIGAGSACLATMGMGLLRGQGLLPMFRTAISLGVAAVPEGLPTVAITTLALGLRRMRQERVVIRQLAAVETLGAVQVVCLDKTGTITVNRMAAVGAYAGRESFQLAHGAFVASHGSPVDVSAEDIQALLRIAALCNEVELEQTDGVTVLHGSPTESALVQLALDAGVDVRAVRARHPLLSVQLRAQARNYMSTLHADGDRALLAVKGRPSEVLALASSYLRDGERRPLSETERARIETENERMAGRALRVLGFAYLDRVASHDQLPAELVWVGLIGMEDPPRQGVADVIARFHGAGVRTVMITGDQSATAQAVGRQVGIATDGSLEVIDSTRLDRIEPQVLQTLARRADVFSRVSPAHKLQIVKALQDAGTVVAMTGDGVNDGPALKAADIGIAMGTAGAAAARELADVVLEDDQLSTLIVAIEQGRTIYDDIRKAVHFILSTNLTEILYTFTCVASGVGEPLTPLQLLWINLVTDVFPELALAAQPPETDVLARPPRDPTRPMFTRSDLLHMGTEGLVITAGSLAGYFLTAGRAGAGPRAGTVGFTALTFAQLLHAVSAQSESHTVFHRGHLERNKWLPLALGGTGLMQLAASFAPGLRTLLGAVPMGPADWLTALAAAGVPFLVNETFKYARHPRPTAGSAQPAPLHWGALPSE